MLRNACFQGIWVTPTHPLVTLITLNLTPLSCFFPGKLTPPHHTQHYVTLEWPLTFPGAVRTQTLRALWQRYTLLHVISQNYCSVFVKSYNIVFKHTRKDPSMKSDQKNRISVNMLWVSFCHRNAPMLWSSHQKNQLSRLHQCYCC